MASGMTRGRIHSNIRIRSARKAIARRGTRGKPIAHVHLGGGGGRIHASSRSLLPRAGLLLPRQCGASRSLPCLSIVGGVLPDDEISREEREEEGRGGESKREEDAVWWVKQMNGALDDAPTWTLTAFVLVDMSSALCLYALLAALNVRVSSDFALAFALSKSIRAPRLALDAVGAKRLTEMYPLLKDIRVSRLVDAGEEVIGHFKQACRGIVGMKAQERNENVSKKNRIAAEVKTLTDSYGLAYMAAKNVIGPVSILLFYFLLRAGVNLDAFLGQKMAASSLGKGASRLALASFLSVFLFPAVTLSAAYCGPALKMFMQRPLRSLRYG